MTRIMVAALGITLAFAAIALNTTRTLTPSATQIGKHGADDPPGDVKGEGPRHPKSHVAKNGADDPPGDVKGEGPKHPKSQVAKNGADDPPGDVKGEGPKHPKAAV